jgi:hypothetical protein
MSREGIDSKVTIQPEWRCLACPELRGHTAQLPANQELTAPWVIYPVMADKYLKGILVLMAPTLAE